MEFPYQFGKYELLQFLGGGMSHVYRARDSVLNREVAVKILTPEGSSDPELRSRFLQEARMSAALVHDNVIRIFDYGEEQGRPFIVMEFLTGQDLRSAIRNQHAGDVASKLRIALQGARALEYVHTQNLIHRDIKPDNLHIDNDGRVRLMDFGIAKATDLSMTRTGHQMGTPFYMAPEQIKGEPATPRTDIYAYGLLIFELFTGKRPVEGDTIERVFYAILSEPVRMEELAASGAPPELTDLVARMTSKDPAQRPATFGEVCAGLQAVFAQEAAPAAAIAVESRSQFSGRTVILAILAIIAVASGLVYVGLKKLGRADEERAQKQAEWPKTKTMKGGEMVLVPSSVFLAGEGKEPVRMPAFYIDRTEVSNAAYAEYATSTSRPLPAGFNAAKPDLPVTNVTIVEAKDFCAWAGKRLPVPPEWEKAARGEDGRRYPWGNEPDASRATIGAAGPVAVTANEAGASPYGVLNMTGNVWEWTDSPRQPSQRAIDGFAAALNPPPTASEPWYTVRGGAYDRKLEEIPVWEFMLVPARFAAPVIGFRCVEMPPQ